MQFFNFADYYDVLKLTKKNQKLLLTYNYELMHLTFFLLHFKYLKFVPSLAMKTFHIRLKMGGRTFWFRLFSLPWFPIHFQTLSFYTLLRIQYKCRRRQVRIPSPTTRITHGVIYYYNLHGVRLSYRMNRFLKPKVEAPATVLLERAPRFCFLYIA